MPGDKRLVYVLKSATPKARYYVGLTSNVRARLADHNAGRCPHTARYRPWQLHVTQLPACEEYCRRQGYEISNAFTRKGRAPRRLIAASFRTCSRPAG
jgi:predicted GIY-YIG superfamily endonuclease